MTQSVEAVTDAPTLAAHESHPLTREGHERGAFDALVARVSSCRRCPRMEGRTRVLGEANGPLSARVLFVAEAPGRLGADALGIPLAGDRTGRTFEQLLTCAGLRRSDIFITNAVLCNPRDAKGRNDRPSRSEIVNCSNHLVQLITILDPAWVVTLGLVALQAIAAVEPHTVCLQNDVCQPGAWFGRYLVPLYHPGPRALIRRPQHLQEHDYRQLAALIAAAIERMSGSPIDGAQLRRDPTP